MGRGVVALLVLGAGLMFPVFYSNRRAIDDPDNRNR